MPATVEDPWVVAYEDRSSQLVGMKLMLLSLQRHSPSVHVDAYVPNAPDDFVTWFARIPNATLHPEPVEKRGGYDVKPILLSQSLQRRGGTAMWIDSDVIVNGDVRSLLAGVPADELVVTEEPLAMPYQGGSVRSRAWGLTTARELPATTNTAVVRVSERHVELLRVWHEMLGRPTYREAQAQPWDARPIHLMGDQEVLCALLESTDFADVPVHFIRRGREIAHCFQHHGYMFHQMVANLVSGRRPSFVHCHGLKPWLTAEPDVHLDTSPYTLLAKDYAADLDEPTGWMEAGSKGGRRLVRLSGGNPWTASLPLAAYKEVRDQRLARTGVKKLLGRD